MRLDDGESSNVEDRRGMSAAGVGGLGIGGVVVALIASYFLGIDPAVLLDVANSVAPATQQQQHLPPQDARDEGKVFIARVLASTEKTWADIFQQMGRTYEKPVLVLFSGSTRSGCGQGQAAMGPFYCPNDQKVYIDLKFYEDLRTRFRAPGDFAQAYVIAHEIGHHVQNQLGTFSRLENARGRMSRAEGNQVSVRMELQADCYAGVWANHTEQRKHFLEQGDIEEALNAATAIGDDRLQQQTQGRVVPESFTHGSSAQRVRWFKTGVDTGSLKACDTFAAGQL